MFQYNCEVFYEDTDMGGRVYHANYLKFTERARSKFIESLHVDQRAMLLAENKFFVVKNIIADYLLPAYFGDKLVICTTLIELKRVSMMLKQEILKDSKKIFAFFLSGLLTLVQFAYLLFMIFIHVDVP